MGGPISLRQGCFRQTSVRLLLWKNILWSKSPHGRSKEVCTIMDAIRQSKLAVAFLQFLRWMAENKSSPATHIHICKISVCSWKIYQAKAGWILSIWTDIPDNQWFQSEAPVWKKALAQNSERYLGLIISLKRENSVCSTPSVSRP